MSQRTAEVWAKPPDNRRIFWRQHPVTQGYVNRRITGDSTRDVLRHAKLSYFAEPADRVLSLACGHGSIDRSLISLGIADRVDAVDISPGAIKNARRLAAEAGIADRIHYAVADMNDLRLERDTYDAVFSFAAVHHSKELETLFDQIRLGLREDGIFVLNEYVGPSRFQMEPRVARTIDRMLKTLPPELRLNLLRDDGTCVESFKTPPFDAHEPSEAIRSSEIRPLLPLYFEIVEYKEAGGTLLNWGLTKIVGNFDPDDTYHTTILNLLCLLEETMEEFGGMHSDVAFIAARPRRFRADGQAVPPSATSP